MFFSVIMATKNNEPYLSAAIDSILNQTFIDWELIIVNDCSTDNTSTILENYCQSNRNIRVVTNNVCMGVGHSRNLAISLSSGKWIAVMDGDDACHPTRLALLHAAIIRDPTLVLVGSYSISCNSFMLPQEYLSYPLEHESILTRLMYSSSFCLPSCALHRETVISLGGYNPSLAPADDYDLSIRMSLQGHTTNVPKYLYYYRIHSSSLTSIYNTRMLLLSIYIRLKSFIEYGFQFHVYHGLFIILQFLMLLTPTTIRRVAWRTFLRYAPLFSKFF